MASPCTRAAETLWEGTKGGAMDTRFSQGAEIIRWLDLLLKVTLSGFLVLEMTRERSSLQPEAS